MISQKGGVVCSDGRKHSSITIKEDETSDDKATIESDNYNKTFIIQNKLVGAYCGLLEFSNKNISEHISEIVENKMHLNYEEIVTLIETELKNKLLLISIDEIRFKSRKIDLLLVGRNDKKRMQISALRLFPENNTILSSKEIVITDGENKYYSFGDDNAQRSAGAVINRNKASNTDISFLKKLSKNAINAGINYSGYFLYSDEKACGGNVYSRSI
jgi:hypothetical protein